MHHIQTSPEEPGKPRFTYFDFSTLHPDQSLTEEMVCAFLCLSRSTVRKKIKHGGAYFDPTFPLPRQMRGGARKGCAIRWRAGDIMAWSKELEVCDYRD
jgi:predicted DNA-binding transcriptional regulator AlpA